MSSELKVELKVPNYRIFLLELLRIGTVAFGGPIVNLNMMKASFVEKYEWMPLDEFFQRMGLCKLLPGPITTLVALSVGRRLFGPWRAILALLFYVFPSFAIVCAWFYLEPLLHDHVNSQFADALLWSFQLYIFFAITEASVKLLKDFWKNLPYAIHVKLVYSLAILAIAITAIWMKRAELEIIVLIAVFAVAVRGLLPKMDRLRSVNISLYLFFLKASLIVFGTGYMIFPFIEKRMVAVGTLSQAEFAKGLLVGNLSPGPVLIASTYYGLVLQGFWGGVLATLGIFSGPVILTLLLFPLLEKGREKAWVQHLAISISPAVVVILMNFNLGFLHQLDFSWVSALAIMAFTINALVGSTFLRSLLIATVFALLRYQFNAMH